jgi:TPR repeat protein
MKILKKICFVLLMGMFSSVYGASCAGFNTDFNECRRQAKQGNATAQTYLGLSHQLGDGVIQDYVLAHMYYNIAAVSGDGVALSQRRMIETMMSQSQIQEAQRMAREWMRKHQ